MAEAVVIIKVDGKQISSFGIKLTGDKADDIRRITMALRGAVVDANDKLYG